MKYFFRVFLVPFKKLFYEAPEKGALTQIMLAVEPELETVTGKYFTHSKETEPTDKAKDDDTAEWLWTKSQQLTGTQDLAGKF